MTDLPEGTWRINGKVVTHDEFMKNARGLEDGDTIMTQSSAGYPYHCEAMAVHPDERAMATETLRTKGVSVEYDGDGRPKIESRAHRRAMMKAMGLHDRNTYDQ